MVGVRSVHRDKIDARAVQPADNFFARRRISIRHGDPRKIRKLHEIGDRLPANPASAPETQYLHAMPPDKIAS
jgi:hypothetical protein